MEDLNKEIRDRKFLLFAAVSGIVLVAAVFLIAALVSKNKKAENTIAPAAPKEKSMEEIIKDLTAPLKNGETPTPVSEEVIKSLTAPIKANGTDSKKSKTVQPTPIPISEDVIKSLTAPIAK